ncbi:hypothetical protein [Neoroseomonas oryzicola]|uniref:PIN domain-containing protein n=1 Tax=Neoroseomonas oryzicola TaxID=535904 RepID=A0A9X9WMJ3_9PROT|nr:hypothetical protein [Neoroseomonas oryzicola]MBR0661553.1 hypothetical protein [Neoroseomonas oryzicola]NKE18389.1 hypothetical protein [Neoroseomonas oryzicola]
MKRRIIVIDTSILCCWLRIPGKETAGSGEFQWDFERVKKVIDSEVKKRSTLVLPVATIIETGNHIAQCSGDRFNLAQEFANYLRLSANAETPWAAFTEQLDLWSSEKLNNLANDWPNQAVQRRTIGDVTINHVANWYSKAGYEVEILTGDAGLKAYEPKTPMLVPRRRQF